jgi:TolB-like protein/Tfp pilus assembly protein PilF
MLRFSGGGVVPRVSIIRLGKWLVEPARGTIAGGGRETRLEPKVMAVLVHLAGNAGRVVSKDELLDRVWEGAHVVEGVLTRAVSILRRALGSESVSGCRIETIPTKGYRLVGEVQRVLDAASAARPRTVAVLPFRILSGEQGQEYLADGFTEFAIASLSRVRALRVISRTSVARYRETTRPLPEIARELGVEFIVEGSVILEGQDVQVVAQLIDAATDTHLWAGEYRRAFRDVLSIQGDVARAIAREIEVEVTPDEERRLSRREPVDPRSQDAYMRGLYGWSRRSPEGFAAALRCFQEAIELDPAAARPYAGMGLVFLVQGLYGILPPREAFASCEQASQKAIELDEELAEAHAVAAGPKLFVAHDYPAAERQMRRAIALSPSLAVARLALADLLAATGRLAEAVAEMEIGRSLTPFDVGMNMNLGDHLVFARRFDEGIAQHRRTVEMEPSFRRARLRLARACAQAGRREEATAALEAALALASPVGPGADDACVLACLGRGAEARALLAQLEARFDLAPTQSWDVAMAYAALGDADTAFAWLEKALDAGAGMLVFIGIDHGFDALRSDPRFPGLLARLRLPA